VTAINIWIIVWGLYCSRVFPEDGTPSAETCNSLILVLIGIL